MQNDFVPPHMAKHSACEGNIFLYAFLSYRHSPSSDFERGTVLSEGKNYVDTFC